MISRQRRGLLLALTLLTAEVCLPLVGLNAQGREPAAQEDADKTKQSSPNAKANLISESMLAGLPLNGRSYTQLLTLDAGVSDSSSASSSRGVGGGSLTFSGSRSSSNSFLLDGTSIMDAQNRPPRSAAGVQLGSDSVFQVQVFSANYGPEYGRNNGGVMNSISRSGSDEFHGTLFEYFRNSKLDAPNYFDRDRLRPGFRTDPPPFKRNQFGFTLTGPLRKGKTYVMGSFEAMRDRLNETKIDTFPDAEARQGIITNALGEEIRRVTVNPSVEPYLNLMPLPNSTRIGGGFAQNSSPQFLPTNENFFTIRVDHQISDRDSLFGRYTFDDATSRQAGDTFAFARGIESRQQYLTLVGSHIFSPSVLASSRVSYTRPVDSQNSISSIEIPRSLFFVAEAPLLGQFTIPGGAQFGPISFMPSGNNANTFQFSGDVVAQREKHGLKFGAEVHRYRFDIFSSSSQGAEWGFNSLDSFLQGGPEGTSLTVALPGSSNKKAFRQTLVGLYGQDEIALRPNLQLSLGFRYEFTTLIHDRYGRDAFLADAVRSTEVTVGPVLPNNPSLRNFSPRLGLSWSPGGSRDTTVNAGFGIYYDHLMAHVFDILKSGLPFYRIALRPNFDSSQTFPDAVRAATEVGFPLQAQNLDYQGISSPAMLRYNLTIQQRLPRDSNLQLGYVGARGNHLLRNFEANLFPPPTVRSDGSLCFPPDAAKVQPQDINPNCPPVPASAAGPVNPAFQGGINLMTSDAQSFYHALLISADARPGPSLSLRATYTYSKSVDDASAFNFRGTQQFGPLRTQDRGLSDFDIRHRVTTNFFYAVPSAGAASAPWTRVVSQIVGSWRVGGILSFRTGVPTTPQINIRRAGYLFAATRPNLLEGQSNNPTEGSSIGCGAAQTGQELGGPNLWFDPCVFDVPAAGTLGNLGRNTLIGPSVFNVDVSLQREFALGSNRRLQFRAEFFNLMNHPNFRTPTGNSLVLFTGSGRFNPSAVRYTGTATTSRQTQFALRLSF